MAETLPSIVLTGASGFVGRNFLATARERFLVYAIARRPQQSVGVPHHPNIRWIQVDIGHRESFARVMGHVRERGGADFFIHLAAHYDFDNEERPEFEHTNVNGTRHALEQAELMGVKRFVFASSVAACNFPAPGEALTEESPPDADFPYAVSKRIGEEMVADYSERLPCSIVRLAAVFSDWCEYAPLYVFLSTWLSRAWNSRILGGKGASAVPYIHTRDVNRLLFTLIRRSAELPRLRTYIASPDGSTSHRDLFTLATHFHLRREIEPILMPRPLAWLGIVVRDLVGRAIGRRPFERPWMMEYLDLALDIDASRTRRELGWSPTPRLHILRRILFLIEKMKSQPREWFVRNETAMKRPPDRPALTIHDAMMEAKDAIVDAITAYIHSPVRQDRFPTYARMGFEELSWYVGIVYEHLMAAVRTGDRSVLLSYIRDLAHRRFAKGFPPSEICDALIAIGETTIEELLYKPQVAEYEDELRDSLTLSTALAVDGVQDAFESLDGDAHAFTGEDLARGETFRELEARVAQLNAFYRPFSEQLPSGPTRAPAERSDEEPRRSIGA
jgi:nucleoside-diphosphate-sugar epimerase